MELYNSSKNTVRCKCYFFTNTNSVAFTLLNGYRPANEQWHAVFGSPNTNFINIETNGDVRISDSEITFFNLLIPLDY
jgi:hypothetical protein